MSCTRVPLGERGVALFLRAYQHLLAAGGVGGQQEIAARRCQHCFRFLAGHADARTGQCFPGAVHNDAADGG